MIENPWGHDFFRLDFEDLRSFQMEQIQWSGVWSSDHEVRTNIKEMLNKRISPTNPDVGKTSLLIWFRTIDTTLKLECKRIWLPGWVITNKETGTEYTIEGIGGSISLLANVNPSFELTSGHRLKLYHLTSTAPLYQKRLSDYLFSHRDFLLPSRVALKLSPT